MLLKGAAAGALKACATRALQEHAEQIQRDGVKIIVDVDPILMM
jgi:hypothetical protein